MDLLSHEQIGSGDGSHSIDALEAKMKAEHIEHGVPLLRNSDVKGLTEFIYEFAAAASQMKTLGFLRHGELLSNE